MAPKKQKREEKSDDKAVKVNMTEEERLIYVEQQRVAEEEMKKKKEDMLMNFLKDKLSKEEKSTRFNLHKLNHQWRNILREAKAKDLKKDIEILSQTFERIIDRKESVIKSLAKDLLEAEEQYAMAHRNHIQNVDHLIDLQRQRLATLQAEFGEELNVIKLEFDTELEMIELQHETELSELEDILFAMELNYNERDEGMKLEFQSSRDELKNKSLEEKHAFRVNMEIAVDKLWTQFQEALGAYNDATSERKGQFEALRSKDKDSARTIKDQMAKLQRVADRIAQLRAMIASNARDNEERNRYLKEDKDKMTKYFRELKSQLIKMRQTGRENLTKLTVTSEDTLTELRRQSDKGERIIKFAELCRKLETEEEKVLPFYVNSLSNDEQDDVNQAVNEPPSEELAKVLYEYEGLENFWKRYNKVKLDVHSLEKEKSLLDNENQRLRKLLKQYLDGISVNDEILSHTNPLLIVHNQNAPMRPIQVPVMDERVKRSAKVVVEAAHHSKHLQLPM